MRLLGKRRKKVGGERQRDRERMGGREREKHIGWRESRGEEVI